MRLSEAEKQLKLQHWATLIQEYNDSGLKLKDWLCENNIFTNHKNHLCLHYKLLPFNKKYVIIYT